MGVSDRRAGPSERRYANFLTHFRAQRLASLLCRHTTNPIPNTSHPNHTMFSKLAVIAMAFVGGSSAAVINADNGDVPVASDAGRHLMENARSLNNGQYYSGNYVDTSNMNFLQGYSVKFQGCHHVQQWNADAQGEEDVRIMTKRLVRFRLCPASECAVDLGGCTSHYGDYVVDMETYISAYYQSITQDNGNAYNYLSCTAFEAQNYGNYYGNENENVQTYVGPFCAEQGGEIRLGLFTDDTCTSFAQNQGAIEGMTFTGRSMVSTSCTSCAKYGNDYNQNGVSDFCESIYEIAGKCESKMQTYNPNEAACGYIEGIKIIRQDGVIRSSATRKSKAASISIAAFLSISVLLAAYVYYLRTKLSRAKINLNAADATLA